MRTIRVFALVAFAILVALAPAYAGDLTGIYMAQYRGGVEYFNLTDQGGYITGYLQTVAVNTNYSDGVNRQNYSVSGSVNGSRAVLRIASGLSSYQWTADISWGGFTVSIPMQSGQISQVYFHRSSVAEVNRVVASLNTSGKTVKYYANTQAELADSQTRLSNDVNYYRPRILNEIIAAKKKLAAALEKKKQADAKLVEKQQIAAQAHQAANAAKAAAVTNDEQYAANDLEYKANSADYDVNSAKYDVNSAQTDVTWAENDLKSAKDDLVKVDARIAQLRGIIGRDKLVLHVP
ncbi:MAG TPA: hypothetical protein VJP85_11025 [Candidatus Baltobacteraceae bacterium]|nr:hypothetical protein [Candidatus Baltobacteraceae bacterium]